MYRTFVLPLLDYGAVIYSPRSARNIKLVESVQRNFTRRLVSGNCSLTYSQRLELFHLDSLELRRLKADLIETYKIVYGIEDIRFDDFFRFAPHSGTRSNGLKLAVTLCKTDIRKHFFSNRVVSLWNAMPSYVVTAYSLSHFKRLLNTDSVVYILRRHCRYY